MVFKMFLYEEMNRDFGEWSLRWVVSLKEEISARLLEHYMMDRSIVRCKYRRGSRDVKQKNSLTRCNQSSRRLFFSGRGNIYHVHRMQYITHKSSLHSSQ